MPFWWRAIVSTFAIAFAALGQSQPPPPRFDSAVIRLATLSRAGSRRRADGSHVELLGVSLPQLIRTAYRLEPYQNVTGPAWIRRAYFDIFATLPEGATRDQIPEMLQPLLAEQLNLVLQHVTVMEPVCVLSIGKNGPKLKPPSTETTLNGVLAHQDRRTPVHMQKSSHGYVTYSRVNGAIILDASKISLPELAVLLRREIDRPVLDRTGLQGFYELSLFVPAPWIRSANSRAKKDDLPEPPAPDPEALLLASEPQGVNLYKSIQRLGLKLEKTKAPIEHLVVEHAEARPVER